MQFTRAFTKKLNEKLVEIGLYQSQWLIIFYLKQLEPATLVELSQSIDVEKPTISRTVSRLAELQFIETVPSKDKRERKIKLTEKGQEAYEQAIVIVNEFEHSLLEGIPEADVEIAFQTIQRLKDKL